jgi:myosin-1
MGSSVAFGKTKLFVKEPSSLVRLEEAREAAIPRLVAKIQARYRGVLARRRVLKIRAVYKIISYWHASHLRGYLNTLCKTFEGVASWPDLGRSKEFPPAPPGLNNFVVSCKRIHLTWRAHKILARYSKEEQEDLKKKALASDLLGGRRAYW